MRDDEPLEGRRRGTRGTALVIGCAVALLGLAGSCALGVGAVSLGVARPPAFSVPIGQTWLVAPCPAEMNCPAELPYYAIWEGERQPDGSTTYELRYFTYLPRRR